MQLGFRKLGREPVPDRNGQVFGRRNTRAEFRNFLVQEPVIHCVENFAVHSLFELLEIHNKPRTWVNFALHGDFEDIVVTVSIGIIAFTKQPSVLFRRELRIVIVVRCGEFCFAGEIEQGGGRSSPFQPKFIVMERSVLTPGSRGPAAFLITPIARKHPDVLQALHA